MEKYLAKLEELSEDSSPEEFELILKAYDVLGDPKRREQYDLIRKHGKKLEELAERSTELISQEEYEQAEALVKESLSLVATPAAFIMLGKIALSHHGDLALFNQYVEEAKGVSHSDPVLVDALKVTMLVDAGYLDEAYDLTINTPTEYPEGKSLMRHLQVPILMRLEKYDQVLEVMDSLMPREEELNIDDLDFLMTYINGVSHEQKRASYQRAQRVFKAFVRNLEPEDREIAIDAFVGEYEESLEYGYYRTAELMASLLLSLEPKDQEYRQWLQRVKPLAELETALARMEEDQEVFPSVQFKAHMFFRQENPNGFDDDFDLSYNDMVNDLIENHGLSSAEAQFAIALSIGRLKKRHALVYSKYKRQWEQLFNEATDGMNREERRSLLRG